MRFHISVLGISNSDVIVNYMNLNEIYSATPKSTACRTRNVKYEAPSIPPKQLNTSSRGHAHDCFPLDYFFKIHIIKNYYNLGIRKNIVNSLTS